jgi:hypothetical protein
MSNRRWLPARYQDEVIPPPRESPSAWVITLPGDAYAIAPIEDGCDRDPWILREGDVIEFDWTVDLGDGQLAIAADGSWELDIGEAPQPPEGAHLCVLAGGEIDSLSDSVETLVEGLAGDDGVFDIDFYAWSKAPQHFVFRGGAFVAEASCR